MLKSLKIWILCTLHGHDWTSNSQKGIKPTKQQIDKGWEGFIEYSTMWCDRCGKVHKPLRRPTENQ